MPLVALTTDFGTRDAYVAAMKGVLYSRCPGVQIIDLSHEIPPQDVFEGALFLAEAAPYFPEGTVHCVVIDPGVGTARLPIIVYAGKQYFVCPDNGVLALFVQSHPVEEARSITNRAFMRNPISSTFHGRDIFAPAAAGLAAGAPIEEAGERLATLTMLDTPKPKRDKHGRIEGVVMHIDRFGNAITNVHRGDLKGLSPVEIRAGRFRLHRVSDTYGDAEEGRPLALFGSSDYIEIAVNRGSAHDTLGLIRGQRVELRF
jgi:hypothetical protein